MRKFNEHLTPIGARFGSLVVVGDRKIYDKRVLCQCDCGQAFNARIAGLTSGETTHCYSAIHINGRHMDSQPGEFKYLYDLYNNIKKRCYDVKCPTYKHYGGRGIEFKFENYEEFKSWILSELGPRPSKQHSMDRKDNDGNYERGNLRWADKKEQANNRRIVVHMSQDEYSEYIRWKSEEK